MSMLRVSSCIAPCVFQVKRTYKLLVHQTAVSKHWTIYTHHIQYVQKLKLNKLTKRYYHVHIHRPIFLVNPVSQDLYAQSKIKEVKD